ncbi:hypothetical protein HAX54_022809 [Datura stramonium]|uniref:Uncharacterized protein n=1 Tax=Datura stramonium TaxID=4076 RepID=A0ABS8Y6J6_DATST|nr:hypothetical protein [Datura stramonium]
MEEVRIINSKFPEYPYIEDKYKFYGLGWMSEAPGIDMETHTTKKYDLEKSKDESRYELKLYKPIPEMFGPSGQNARAVETSTEPVRKATKGELVFQAAPIHTFTPSTFGATMP